MKYLGKILFGATLMTALNAPAQQATVADNGWLAIYSQSPMDGEKTITLSQSTGDGAELIIRCNSTLDVYVATDRILDKNFERGYGSDVRVRLDQEKAKQQAWFRSDDSKAVFSQSPRALLVAMRQHKRLLFEYTPYEEQPRVAAFDLNGIDAAVSKYYECRRLLDARPH